MKHLLFILILFVVQQTYGQKRVSKVASMVPTANAIMLSHLEAKRFEKSFFKRPRTMGRQFIYRIDNILMGYDDYIDKSGEGINLDRALILRGNLLKRLKAKGFTIVSQKINYKNAAFVLQHLKAKDNSQIFFVSESRNGKSIMGHIRYKNADSVMARNVLDGYLSSFTFLID